MEFNNQRNPSSSDSFLKQFDHVTVAERSKTFMANVFMYMFLALGISAVVAYLFASSPTLLIPIAENGILRMAVMFAPLIFVLTMSFAFNKLSAPVLLGIFLLYSVINGISFSFILLIYTASSVIGVFASAAIMFGVMALVGYKTQQDLTSMGRLMMMALIGLIVASVINWFLKSDTMGYVISFVGVLVFVGLTAYDVQKLKRIGEGLDENGTVMQSDAKKLAIMGGLTLYLDFINLFLFLLRLFGNRR